VIRRCIDTAQLAALAGAGGGQPVNIATLK
jgi:hypothetical protein